MASTSPQFAFGSGILYGIRNDTPALYTPQRFGTMQDVSIDFTAEIKELFGQLQYPVDVARGKTKIMGKAKLATIQASMYNDLFFGVAKTTAQQLYAYNETGTIPASVAYTVTAANGATFSLDLGVYYANTGLPFTRVVSAPAAGQYSVNSTTGVYTFAVADASAPILLNYNYAAATGGNTIVGNNLYMGTTPKFQAVFQSIYEGHTINLTLFSCVSSKLTIPTKNDDYTIAELDFSAFANAGGQVFSMSMDN